MLDTAAGRHCQDISLVNYQIILKVFVNFAKECTKSNFLWISKYFPILPPGNTLEYKIIALHFPTISRIFDDFTISAVYSDNYRRSCLDMFYKKTARKNLSKLLENKCIGESF